MKIDALTQTLSPYMQAKKSECCTTATPVNLTGPNRDIATFSMNPTSEVAGELGSASNKIVRTIADELPKPELPMLKVTTDELPIPKNTVDETTNPFKKFVEEVKAPNVVKAIPDNAAIEEAAKLGDLQRTAFMSANAGF